MIAALRVAAQVAAAALFGAVVLWLAYVMTPPAAFVSFAGAVVFLFLSSTPRHSTIGSVVSLASSVAAVLCQVAFFMAYLHYWWTGPRFHDWSLFLRVPAAVIGALVFGGLGMAAMMHAVVLVGAVLGISTRRPASRT